MGVRVSRITLNDSNKYWVPHPSRTLRWVGCTTLALRVCACFLFVIPQRSVGICFCFAQNRQTLK